MSWFSSFFTNQPSSPKSPHSDEKRLLEIEPNALTNHDPVEHSEPLKPFNIPAVENPHRSKIIFAAGATFFAFSLLITRRSFARRRLATNPAFYTNAPAHHAEQSLKASGPVEAVEALSIATVNVLSLSMLAAGGTLWYFDINSMADARRKLRGGLGVDGTGRNEQDAEEEFEEWMATVLSRKEAKEATKTMRTNDRGSER